MTRTIRTIVIIIATAIAGATATAKLAWATDFCLESTAPGFIWVGKGFTLPGRGHCKPWIGFVYGMAGSQSIGSACVAFDGSHVTFTINTSTPFPGGLVQTDHFDLDLPLVKETGSRAWHVPRYGRRRKQRHDDSC